MAILLWRRRAASSGSSHMVGRRPILWVTGCSASTRNCATVIGTLATALGLVSKSTGTLSIGTAFGHHVEHIELLATPERIWRAIRTSPRQCDAGPTIYC